MLAHGWLRVVPFLALLVLPAIPVDAYASPDRVFRSGFEPALVIEGRAGWAVPLAGASVELRFGNQVNTTTTAADGSFEVGVELDELDGGDILELTARGTGAQAHLAWASPLGPAGRLLELAGASHRLDFAREPYVHLNPRTTVDAAMMRAFHGGQPIMDAKAYYHAALKRHSWSNRLVFAAAMVERGALELPAGAADTFETLLDVDAAAALNQAFLDAAYADSPDAILIIDTLPRAADVYPAATWKEGALYSALRPDVHVPPVGGYVGEYGFVTGPGLARVLVAWETVEARPAQVTVSADGTHEFTATDGLPFASFESYPYVGGEQVRSILEIIGARVRLLQGPGGTWEMQVSSVERVTYPDNPDIPPELRSPLAQMTVPATDGATPAELLPALPEVANRSFALPVLAPTPDRGDPASDFDDPFGVGVHHFGTAGGVVERFGTAFDFTQVPGEPSFALAMDGWEIAVQFINEEEPGLWRVRLHGVNGAREAVVDGVMLETEPSVAFSAAMVPGRYYSTINGCTGAYRWLYDHCVDPLPGPSFLADGGMDEWWNTPFSGWWAEWRLGSGPDAGRLIMEHWLEYLGAPYALERRGWQLLRQDGGQVWVLENLNVYSWWDSGDEAVPVSFATPTNRLIRYDREP